MNTLVEPPAYGVYEVLLPDEIASRWQAGPYQCFTFDPKASNSANGRQITFLHYGHPIVEEIINEARARAANARFYINNVRAEKTGLFAVAEKTLKLTNARLLSFQRRLKRYLELDRARLEQYYDDLLKDLERRLKNSAEERRPALKEKIAAVQAERQAKLADVVEKYQLRVDLELVN